MRPNDIADDVDREYAVLNWEQTLAMLIDDSEAADMKPAVAQVVAALLVVAARMSELIDELHDRVQ